MEWQERDIGGGGGPTDIMHISKEWVRNNKHLGKKKGYLEIRGGTSRNSGNLKILAHSYHAYPLMAAADMRDSPRHPDRPMSLTRSRTSSTVVAVPFATFIFRTASSNSSIE